MEACLPKSCDSIEFIRCTEEINVKITDIPGIKDGSKKESNPFSKRFVRREDCSYVKGVIKDLDVIFLVYMTEKNRYEISTSMIHSLCDCGLFDIDITKETFPVIVLTKNDRTEGPINLNSNLTELHKNLDATGHGILTNVVSRSFRLIPELLDLDRPDIMSDEESEIVVSRSPIELKNKLEFAKEILLKDKTWVFYNRTNEVIKSEERGSQVAYNSWAKLRSILDHCRKDLVKHFSNKVLSMSTKCCSLFLQCLTRSKSNNFKSKVKKSFIDAQKRQFKMISDVINRMIKYRCKDDGIGSMREYVLMEMKDDNLFSEFKKSSDDGSIYVDEGKLDDLQERVIKFTTKLVSSEGELLECKIEDTKEQNTRNRRAKLWNERMDFADRILWILRETKYDILNEGIDSVFTRGFFHSGDPTAAAVSGVARVKAMDDRFRKLKARIVWEVEKFVSSLYGVLGYHDVRITTLWPSLSRRNDMIDEEEEEDAMEMEEEEDRNALEEDLYDIDTEDHVLFDRQIKENEFDLTGEQLVNLLADEEVEYLELNRKVKGLKVMMAVETGHHQRKITAKVGDVVQDTEFPEPRRDFGVYGADKGSCLQLPKKSFDDLVELRKEFLREREAWNKVKKKKNKTEEEKKVQRYVNCIDRRNDFVEKLVKDHGRTSAHPINRKKFSLLPKRHEPSKIKLKKKNYGKIRTEQSNSGDRSVHYGSVGGKVKEVFEILKVEFPKHLKINVCVVKYGDENEREIQYHHYDSFESDLKGVIEAAEKRTGLDVIDMVTRRRRGKGKDDDDGRTYVKPIVHVDDLKKYRAKNTDFVVMNKLMLPTSTKDLKFIIDLYDKPEYSNILVLELVVKEGVSFLEYVKKCEAKENDLETEEGKTENDLWELGIGKKRALKNLIAKEFGIKYSYLLDDDIENIYEFKKLAYVKLNEEQKARAFIFAKNVMLSQYTAEETVEERSEKLKFVEGIQNDVRDHFDINPKTSYMFWDNQSHAQLVRDFLRCTRLIDYVKDVARILAVCSVDTTLKPNARTNGETSDELKRLFDKLFMKFKNRVGQVSLVIEDNRSDGVKGSVPGGRKGNYYRLVQPNPTSHKVSMGRYQFVLQNIPVMGNILHVNDSWFWEFPVSSRERMKMKKASPDDKPRSKFSKNGIKMMREGYKYDDSYFNIQLLLNGISGFVVYCYCITERTDQKSTVKGMDLTIASENEVVILGGDPMQDEEEEEENDRGERPPERRKRGNFMSLGFQSRTKQLARRSGLKGGSSGRGYEFYVKGKRMRENNEIYFGTPSTKKRRLLRLTEFKRKKFVEEEVNQNYEYNESLNEFSPPVKKIKTDDDAPVCRVEKKHIVDEPVLEEEDDEDDEDEVFFGGDEDILPKTIVAGCDEGVDDLEHFELEEEGLLLPLNEMDEDCSGDDLNDIAACLGGEVGEPVLDSLFEEDLDFPYPEADHGFDEMAFY